MTNPIKPPHLNEGDLVALISPCGPLAGPHVVDDCVAALEGLGLRVWPGPNAANKVDYLAGTPEERLSDFNKAIRNPEIRGIFCSRGGYGAVHLLKGLDYEAMARDPKVFAGFSDVTAFHNGFSVFSNVQTLHAATIAVAFTSGDSELVPKAKAVYKHVLFGKEPIGSLKEKMNWTDPWAVHSGKAQGRLVAGNLAVFTGLIGTPYLPEPDGKILLIEDTGEEGYKLDRLLFQLKLSGYLDRVEGIALGQFSDSDPSVEGREKIDVVLPRVLSDVDKPILGNIPVGHVPKNCPLPEGALVELDVDGGDLTVLESYAS